jgi:hypothetical protein
VVVTRENVITQQGTSQMAAMLREP